MNITNGRVPFLAALALGATLVAAAGCAPPPPPPPPPQPVAAPPPPPPAPEPPKLAMVGAQLDIPGDIEFDVAQATIKDTPASRATLETVLKIMKENEIVTKVRVEGHTDIDGNAADNQKLSEARAAAVVKWLVDHGLSPARFTVSGCAARDPLVPNDSPAHKARNRRTEFDLEELGGKRPDGYTLACAPNPSRK